MDKTISEDYKGKCGEIFLTVNGNLVIHCTLCEKKFSGYTNYAEHISETHNSSEAEAEVEYQTSAFVVDEMQDFLPEQNSATLFSAEDLNMFNDIELNAPEPECKDIEEYIVSLKNGEPNIELKEIRSVNNQLKVRSCKAKTSKSNAGDDGTSKTQTRNRKYRCPHCDFVTHANSSINQHVARHEEGKRLQCPLCPKKFFKPFEVKIHLRFHNKERPYLCDDCGKSYHTTSALRDHQKRCRNIRNLECTECGKKFFTPLDLRNHMQTHSNTRPFSCDICKASFKLSRALKTHIKIHENNKEYKCQLCPQSFNQLPGLFSHLKSHSIAQRSVSVSLTKTS